MKTGTTVFFEDIDLGLGVEVSGLISSTMMELQAIALALKCVPPFHSVNLFLDSQATLDAYKSELMLGCPDFRNRCWVERHHISNVIRYKNLDVDWIKVRGHSGVLGNERANTLAKAAVSSGVHLPHRIDEHFLKAGGTVVSGNSRHFVHDVFHSIHRAYWEISSGSWVLVDSLRANVDWFSAHTADSQTYFMKALYHRLPVAVQKHLYDKGYPSVMCLFCGNVEISDHVFSCPFDAGDHVWLMNAHASVWEMHSGLSYSTSCVLQLLSACISNAVVDVAICKGFVFNKWYHESFSVFKDSKTVAQNIMAFVRDFCLAFRNDIWLVYAKHRAVIEKGGLIPCDGFIPVLVSGLLSVLLSSVVRLLGITDAIESNPFVVGPAATMSGLSVKRRSARVLTTGSVGSGLTQKVKKPLSGVKLSSADKNLKDSGPVSMDGQFTSMDMDGEASDGRATSDSQMNTPNVKHFNTGAAISFFLSSINYDIDDEEKVEVAVKKSFALNINFLAVEEKSAMAKTQVIRKLFSGINGFGGATTSSKFEEIIRSMFTLSESMEKAASLAKENNIIVNSNLKRQRIHSDWVVVIKKISMNMPKEIIVATVSEFKKIKSIKIQLIGLWQKAVVEFAELEQAVFLAARWSFLIGAGKKTCVINWSLETGNRICCAVVCFDSNKVLESAFHTEPIFGGVKLSWARLNLVCCEWCGKFGHSALKCDAEVASALKFSKFFIRPANLDTRLQLAKLYIKKNIPIFRSVAFGGKSWAQVVSVASVSHGFCAGSGSSSSSSSALSSDGAPPPLSVVNSPLSVCLALLECSVRLLSDQILNILFHLDNIGSAPLAPFSQMVPSVVVSQSPTSVPLVVANSGLDFDMAVDDLFVQLTFLSPGITDLLLGLSSSKVLTFKVGGLKSKLVAFDISIGLILAKLDQLCAGSGSLVIFSLQ
ncbi:hypothetical protein G9A89_013762 [Geosiphon pyriformis]|nr:hypothetical protein G9A89_013762 [Geosiphon pyriformis]